LPRQIVASNSGIIPAQVAASICVAWHCAAALQTALGNAANCKDTADAPLRAALGEGIVAPDDGKQESSP